MRTRAVVGSVIASAAVITIGWVIGSAGTTPAATPITKLANGTYSGSVEETRYGPVQVEITVSGKKITDVKALQLTDADSRSQQISNDAAPILRSEVLAATFTTEGYLTSLQSALDKAKA
jgi:uncharacterized protein with FMN-binding domain